MSLEERIERGRRAAQLLADETFVAAGLDVAEQMKKDMFATKPGDAFRREEIFAEYKGFQRVLERLSTWRSDGLIAVAEMEKRS